VHSDKLSEALGEKSTRRRSQEWLGEKSMETEWRGRRWKGRVSTISKVLKTKKKKKKKKNKKKKGGNHAMKRGERVALVGGGAKKKKKKRGDR